MPAKALFVTYLLTLSTGLAAASPKECAAGPTYWCKSVQNAENCGAIRHCTDTIWRSDHEHALADPTTACKWCQRILENTHKGIQDLAGHEDLIVSTLTNGCKFLPSNDVSSKCMNLVTNYATPVTLLMQHERYATLCRLMNVCSSESSNENPPVLVGQHRCTWGPSYWCSSLSNSRECNSVAHCSDQIWSRQAIAKKSNENICRYCEFVIGKLRAIIVNNTAEIDVGKWLSGACAMVQKKEIVDNCVQTMSKYGEEILVLVQHDIDPGVICHLGQMCKDATIVVRPESEDNPLKEKEASSADTVNIVGAAVDEQSRMLCNTIVRATYELHANQQKSAVEIRAFLKNDCRQLSTAELIHKCESLVDQRGDDIYKHVASNKDLSSVCHHLISSIDSTTVQPIAQTHCDQCTFVLATTKRMLDAREAEDKVLAYLDGHVCAAQTGETLKTCRETLQTNGKEVIAGIQRGTDATRICHALTHCLGVVSQIVNGIDSDKCTSCQTEVKARQTNFRTITNEIAKTRVAFCNDDACRSLVQSDQQEILDGIDKISAVAHCQRLSMCPSTSTQRRAPFLTDLLVNASSDLELSDSICSHFGVWKSTCEHLFISAQSARYMNVYMALLENNFDYIDEDLRGQNTSTCDACKTAVQSVKDFWSNALESVRNALLETCARCQSKDQCRQFWNERVDNLKSGLDTIDSDQICQTIRLCSAVSSSDSCSTCVERWQLQKDAASQAIDRLAGYFNDLCQRFAEKQCQAYVKEVHDAVLKSVNEFDPKETCAAIGFCTLDGNNNEMSFHAYEMDIQNEIEKNICSSLGPFEILCQAVVQGNTRQIQTLKLDYELRDLMQIADGLAQPLPETEDRDECSQDKCCRCIHRVMQRKRRVRFIGDAMFSDLIRSCDRCPVQHQCRQHYRAAKARFDCHLDRIQPKRVCIHFGFCNKTAEVDELTDAPEGKCLETSEPVEVSEIQSADPSNSTCTLCEYAMDMLSSYVNRQSTEKEIEQSLQQLCNQMPSVLQKQCHEYIDNHGPAIIATLLREFDLSIVCHKINLCTSEMKVDVTHIIKADTVSCGVCNYISTYLHAALQRDSSDEALSHALSTTCSQLADEQNVKCQTIMQLFSPHIRRLELSPAKSFCKRLPICQTPMMELKPTVLLKEKETSVVTNLHRTPKCTLCQYVIAYLDTIMKQNKSEQAFEEALGKVCSILPGKERSQCDDFVKTYGSTLARLIADMADPDTICRYLTMCEGAATVNSTSVTDTRDEQTPYTCTICQFIVSRTKHFTGLNQKGNDVHQSLKESCDLFNVDNLKKQCQTFLNQHGSYFLQMISNDMEPRRACQSIQVCGETFKTAMETMTTAPTATSLRYSKCIFGMNYWCASRENAKLCHAEELCQRQVWSKKADVVH